MKQRILMPVVAVWLVLVGVGFRSVLEHDSRPGGDGDPVERWPLAATAILDRTRPNLVLAIHPHCPCTRATLDALEEIAARTQDRAVVHILCYRPKDSVEGWQNTPLRTRAASLNNAVVLDDPDGVEAERFGVETSGHVLLYLPDGVLLYSGGITESRGHVGPSAGRSAVVELLAGGAANRTTHAVYGCPIIDRASATDGE